MSNPCGRRTLAASGSVRSGSPQDIDPELVKVAAGMSQLAFGDIDPGCPSPLLHEPGGPLRAATPELKNIEPGNVRQSSELKLR
jgi:hypothetical protein